MKRKNQFHSICLILLDELSAFSVHKSIRFVNYDIHKITVYQIKLKNDFFLEQVDLAVASR